MAITYRQGNWSMSDFKAMKDRVVLITGASRGMGAASARLLGSHGAAIGVNYHSNESAAQQVVADIVSAGGSAIAVKGDVTEMPQVESIVRQVTDAFGDIDTLVLNANTPLAIAPFVDYKWEDFETRLVAELKCAFFPCKAVVPSMIQHRRGCIIAISSFSSRQPTEGFCAVSAAKSGLDGFVKSLALELGSYNIRVNAIAPALTITDATASYSQELKDTVASMTPLKRNGLPEDVAGAVFLMAAKEAGFITGAYLPVSGGIQML
jgi:3-oxoacyl-[acyl-carrier protein] reductase